MDDILKSAKSCILNALLFMALVGCLDQGHESSADHPVPTTGYAKTDEIATVPQEPEIADPCAIFPHVKDGKFDLCEKTLKKQYIQKFRDGGEPGWPSSMSTRDAELAQSKDGNYLYFRRGAYNTGLTGELGTAFPPYSIYEIPTNSFKKIAHPDFNSIIGILGTGCEIRKSDSGINYDLNQDSTLAVELLPYRCPNPRQGEGHTLALVWNIQTGKILKVFPLTSEESWTYGQSSERSESNLAIMGIVFNSFNDMTMIVSLSERFDMRTSEFYFVPMALGTDQSVLDNRFACEYKYEWWGDSCFDKITANAKRSRKFSSEEFREKPNSSTFRQYHRTKYENGSIYLRDANRYLEFDLDGMLLNYVEFPISTFPNTFFLFGLNGIPNTGQNPAPAENLLNQSEGQPLLDFGNQPFKMEFRYSGSRNTGYSLNIYTLKQVPKYGWEDADQKCMTLQIGSGKEEFCEGIRFVDRTTGQLARKYNFTKSNSGYKERIEINIWAQKAELMTNSNCGYNYECMYKMTYEFKSNSFEIPGLGLGNIYRRQISSRYESYSGNGTETHSREELKSIETFFEYIGADGKVIRLPYVLTSP